MDLTKEQSRVRGGVGRGRKIAWEREKGRGRGIGRGNGNCSRPHQDFPQGQSQDQRNHSINNNYNHCGNTFFSSQLDSAPRSAANSQYQLDKMPKKQIKTRTVRPEEIGIELRQNSPDTSLLPRKPEKFGNLGRRIQVISNCFPIKIPSGYVYHYDVKIKKKTAHVHSEAIPIANDSSSVESEAKDTADDFSSAESEIKDAVDKSSSVHKKYRCLNTKTNRKVISHMVGSADIFNCLYPAYDGKSNLYTRKELQSDFPFKCEIVLPSETFDDPHHNFEEIKQDIYEIELKPVKKFNTQSCAINLESVHAFFEGKTDCIPEEAMMAVETVLRHTPCLRFTPIGRSFYYSPNSGHFKKPIGNGIEIWFGYHQSIRLGQWKPTVNLDIAATTFLSEGPVIDYIADIIGVSIEGLRRIPFFGGNIQKINQLLINKEIRAIHSKYRRKHRIIELSDVSANDKLLRGSDLSVSEYFKQKYGVVLKYPHLPCLQVKPKDRDIFLPLEVCEFTPGQHYKPELTQSQKTSMIKFTTFSPADRFQKIDNIVKTANFYNDKCAREFNLEVSTTPLELEARVLDPPNLIYDGKKRVTPRNGSWTMNSVKFLEGGTISQWLLVIFQQYENLNQFAKLLVSTGQEMGIKINSSYKIKRVDVNDDVRILLSEAKEKFDLVVVVIPKIKPRDQTRIYSSIKKAAETLIGLKTQCIKEERLDYMEEERGKQIVRNLCLKINAKIGGENYTLIDAEMPAIFEKPVIIIGADVSHPAATEIIYLSNESKKKSPTQPSIAACVGSLDYFCKRFAATVRTQLKTKNGTDKIEEIICDLENMTMEVLKAFYHHTKGQKPEKIILYRDGVSEGEFATVKNQEVVSVRKACKRLQSDYEPGITFIVVQKRHHVRFKTKDPRDGNQGGDLRAGTVADTVVTHPLNFDFFLKSQAGNKGTSRPSYYTVIEDDNDFSANDLQKMTYHFCYMYVRCTKSISVPAPVAYAHLVAYRARQYLYDRIRDNGSNKIGVTSGIPLSTLEDIYKEIKVRDELKASMYFV